MVLSPWMLYGLGAIGVPILIHLWQRRRVVQLPFSTLRYLKAVAARTSRASKVENLLLLLLRCVLFALLVVAAARPIILAATARLFGGEVPRTVVLIVDNSASMAWKSRALGEQTRLDLAKTAALAVFDDLNQGDRVAVLTANDRSEALVAEPTVDRAVARAAVEGVRQMQSRGDMAPALRDARKILARAERGIHEVFLFTDSQESGWRPLLANPNSVFDDSWKLADARLTVVRPDDLPANNAAVKKVTIATPYLVPGSPVNGTVVVENASTEAFHDVLEIQLNGERVAQRPADAPAGGAVEVQFAFSAPPVTGQWATAVAKLSGDNLPADDAFHVAIPIYEPPRVLVVEGQTAGPERLRPGFYLRKALTAGFDGGVAGDAGVRTVGVVKLDETPLEAYSIVYLVDPGRLSDRATDRLNRFLDGGGTVALFPGDQTGIDDLAALDFLPAKPVAIRTLPAGRQPIQVTDSTHPLFTNTWDANTPFPALPQQRALEWKAAPEAKTLLAFGATGAASVSGGGVPFLIAGERGSGRVVIVNASADRTWGDLPLSPAFLPLVRQIARLSSSKMGRDTTFVVGDPLPLPAGMPLDKSVRLTAPDGSTREVQPVATSRRVLERAEMQGLYTIRSGERVAVYAVNVDRAESDLHALGSTEFEKITQSAGGVKQLVGVDALKQWLARNRGQAPLWPALLAAAFLVFAGEGILANVMARRRAQGSEHSIRTGPMHRRRLNTPFYGGNPEAKVG